jgi:4-carboxymuconolactone decarboxylase
MARMTIPPVESRTPEQQRVCEEVSRGKRGKLPAPLAAWLHAPELARRALRLGEYLRFETTLPPRETELAIILCARFWMAHVAWDAHKRYALEAGVDRDVVDSIAAEKTPVFVDRRQAVIYEVVTTLLLTKRIPAGLYKAAQEMLGERGLVELVATVGYYCLTAVTLNSFEIGLPEGASEDLNDPQYRSS